MRYERFAWAGGVIMSGIGIYLSYRPIAHDLGKSLVLALASLMIVATILLFPWRRKGDGSASRLIDNFRASVRGNHNNVQIARDHANQTMHISRGIENDKRDER
ncbi:hypothetical protein [Mycobacterium riyadhense]|uniref:Uncharacterized protein n=1 Tax=Mycobacterium riyadhense TaxID=486698 RepID=A0A653EDD0_9MYCO|nr:hypothetical protein [Mycobacterium riyadhense]VTO95536.1 hypothetical protein BIN_B_01017 [Mycobacterium riyadhense]